MNDLHRTNGSETDWIVQALETAPAVEVPHDFAARVMARVPQRPQRRYVLQQALQRKAHVGRSLALAALLILVMSMLLLAPHTARSQTWMLLQGVLFIQLAALLLWMGLSYRRL